MFKNYQKSKLNGRTITLLTIFGLMIFSLAQTSFAQSSGQQTPIGIINGKTIYSDEIINTINNNSPFMPPLDDDKLNNNNNPIKPYKNT